MQLLLVAAVHSAALLMKTLSERVDGVKENGCGGVPIANEMPLERMVPAAETELLVQGRSNGTEPFEHAIVTANALLEGGFDCCVCFCCDRMTVLALPQQSWGQPSLSLIWICAGLRKSGDDHPKLGHGYLGSSLRSGVDGWCLTTQRGTDSHWTSCT